MYKSFLSLLAVICLLLCGCSQEDTLTSQIDYDQESIKLMNEVAPQLVGRWVFREVGIKHQPYNNNQKKLKLKEDTTLQVPATLHIQRASEANLHHFPQDPRHPEFEGTIHYQGKTYPVYFYLLANAERVVSNKGPQAFFLFEKHFPAGTRIPEPEELFLEDIGLLGDNFSLETVPRESKMVWKGINRGIAKIELSKQ